MPDHPTFRPVDLTTLMDEGVLMAANERFFWPLGLALTWDYDRDTGIASGLHVRQFVYEDGHVERMGISPDDQVAAVRRDHFKAWAAERIARMPESEVGAGLLAIVDAWSKP